MSHFQCYHRLIHIKWTAVLRCVHNFQLTYTSINFRTALRCCLFLGCARGFPLGVKQFCKHLGIKYQFSNQNEFFNGCIAPFRFFTPFWVLSYLRTLKFIRVPYGGQTGSKLNFLFLERTYSRGGWWVTFFFFFFHCNDRRECENNVSKSIKGMSIERLRLR